MHIHIKKHLTLFAKVMFVGGPVVPEDYTAYSSHYTVAMDTTVDIHAQGPGQDWQACDQDPQGIFTGQVLSRFRCKAGNSFKC